MINLIYFKGLIEMEYMPFEFHDGH